MQCLEWNPTSSEVLGLRTVPIINATVIRRRVVATTVRRNNTKCKQSLIRFAIAAAQKKVLPAHMLEPHKEAWRQ